MAFDFEPFRKKDGSIDLRAAYEHLMESDGLIPVQHSYKRAERYLMVLEELYPIASRQAAAVALVTAIEIGAD